MSLLADIGLGATATVLAAGYIRDQKSRKKIRSQMDGNQMILVARSNHKFDPYESTQLLARIAQFRRTEREKYTKGQVQFTWRIEKDAEGEIRFYFKAPEDRKIGVKNVLPPTLEWHPIELGAQEAEVSPSQIPTMWLGIEEPLMTLKKIGSRDPLIPILRAMGPQMALEITFSPTDPKHLLRAIKKMHGTLEPALQQKSGGFGQEIANLGKESMVEIGATIVGQKTGKSTSSKMATQKPQTLQLLPHEQKRLQALKQRYADLNQMMDVTMKLELMRPEKNPQAFFQSVLGVLTDVSDGTRLIQKNRPVPFQIAFDELANFVHIPSADVWKSMPIIREHARTLSPHEFSTGVGVGYLQHPIQKERLVSIPDSQLQRHFVLSGMTGAGKSSTLTFIFQSMIDRWITSTDKNPQPGFTFIDPAEETNLVILSRLQAALPKDSPLWEKVHYLSFSNTEYPVGLNMMHIIGVEGVLSLLQGAYGGGARMDRLIRNAVETLQEDSARVNHCVAGISPLLRNEKWRNHIIPNIKNEFLRLFWERDFASFEKNPDSFQPVENRLSPFISGTQKLYFGQPEFVLPIRKWMDEGHIFLVDVKALGKELMYMIIGSLIEHYHWTCQKRPQSTALTHYLMIDECHRVQTPIMQNIIKEDRKYGLSLGLITQSVEQFQTDLKREIKDNLGTIITLRQGSEGAKTTAELSNGHFNIDTLKNLDDFVAAVYTRIDGKAQSLETKAPPPTLYDGFHEESKPVDFNDKTATEKRYNNLRSFGEDMQKQIGRPRKEVEEDLNQYLKVGKWPKPQAYGKPTGKEPSTREDKNELEQQLASAIKGFQETAADLYEL